MVIGSCPPGESQSLERRKGVRGLGGIGRVVLLGGMGLVFPVEVGGKVLEGKSSGVYRYRGWGCVRGCGGITTRTRPNTRMVSEFSKRTMSST